LQVLLKYSLENNKDLVKQVCYKNAHNLCKNNIKQSQFGMTSLSDGFFIVG